MITAITEAFTCVNAAKDLVKAFDGVRTEAAIMGVKMELLGHLLSTQQNLLDAQQQTGALSARIAELEQQIVSMKDWSAEAEGYELADTGGGALAYRAKGTEPTRESGQWLCPNCFGAKQKSYLIPEILALGRTGILRCHPCQLEIITRGNRMPPQSGRR